MEKETLYIATIMFRNFIYTYEGQQFEDFFVKVMSQVNDDFEAVKAYGNIGDEKNDGFDSSTGTYYQVFAPENITKEKTIYSAVDKLEKDFIKLVDNWDNVCKINVFYFVINDKYKGIPSPIRKKQLELEKKKEYNEISLKTFLAKDLEKEFVKLDEIQIQNIIGFIPSPDIKLIEIDALKETVDHLLNLKINLSKPDLLSVPDFNSKIHFNNLSPMIENYLKTAFYQIGSLEEYFRFKPGIKQILQNKFSALYLESQEKISDEVENVSDARFMYILESACSNTTSAIQTSVLVLISYYFSSCDIFEEPLESESNTNDITEETYIVT